MSTAASRVRGRRKTVSILLAGLFLLWGALPARAESSWAHRFTLYFLGAGMSGEVALAGASADLDMSFGDIMENLEFGFMGAFRMQQAKWSVGTDVIYIGLGTSGERGRAELDVDQWMVELNGGYDVRPFFTLIAGVRYNSLANRLFFPASESEFKATEDWVDPLVGGRLSLPFGREWGAQLRADVGGFGIGSDLAWQVMPTLEWRPSDRLSALLGYRVISIDYENEDTGFKYDMTISGPGLGLSGRF